MRKRVVIFVILLSLILLFAGYGLWRGHYWQERNSLAEELGVKLDDYPVDGFPVDYFEEVLKPGMTSGDVHRIIIGYRKVLLCDTNTEFYYYFSTDDNKANRYLVVYNEKGELEYTVTEDTNSRYLQHFVGDCVPGRLGE